MSKKDVQITFEPPLVFHGKEKPTVVIREPKVKDMRVVDQISGSDLEKEMVMICRLTGINEEDLDTLSVNEYKRLQEAYAGFFGMGGPSSDVSA